MIDFRMEDLLREFLQRHGCLHELNVGILARRRFSARMIAVRMGAPVILCEMARNTDWPGYFERRRIRADIERYVRGDGLIQGDQGDVDWVPMPSAGRSTPIAVEPGRGSGETDGEPQTRSSREILRPVEQDRRGAGAIIVFTDIAHSRHLWTWTQWAQTGFVRYIELPLEAEERLGHALTAMESETSLRSVGTGPAFPRFHRDEKELATSILSRFPDPVRRVAARAGLVDWCVRQAKPGELELLWATLRRVRVIDPRCGSGDWLLTMGMWLEAVYTACLDRIRSHAFEPIEICGRRRHTEWTALFFEIEAPTRADDGTVAERHLRRRIVEWNLLGWDVDRRCVIRTRRLLRHYAGSSSGDLEVIPNIRLCASVASDRNASDGDQRTTEHQEPHFTASDLNEELRSLEFARKVAMQTSPGDESADERRQSHREWERRRRALIRKRALPAEENSGASGGCGRRMLDEGSGLWLKEDIRLVRRAARRAQIRV